MAVIHCAFTGRLCMALSAGSQGNDTIVVVGQSFPVAFSYVIFPQRSNLMRDRKHNAEATRQKGPSQLLSKGDIIQSQHVKNAVTALVFVYFQYTFSSDFPSNNQWKDNNGSLVFHCQKNPVSFMIWTRPQSTFVTSTVNVTSLTSSRLFLPHFVWML